MVSYQQNHPPFYIVRHWFCCIFWTTENVTLILDNFRFPNPILRPEWLAKFWKKQSWNIVQCFLFVYSNKNKARQFFFRHKETGFSGKMFHDHKTKCLLFLGFFTAFNTGQVIQKLMIESWKEKFYKKSYLTWPKFS